MGRLVRDEIISNSYCETLDLKGGYVFTNEEMKDYIKRMLNDKYGKVNDCELVYCDTDSLKTI